MYFKQIDNEKNILLNIIAPVCDFTKNTATLISSESETKLFGWKRTYLRTKQIV